MLVNRHIMIAGVIVLGCGMLRYWTGQTKSRVNFTRLLVGGYVFVLILSLVDLSTMLRPVASALADLAAIAVLFSSGVIEWLAGLFPHDTSAREQTGKRVARP